jgi:hypothetical protein
VRVNKLFRGYNGKVFWGVMGNEDHELFIIKFIGVIFYTL